MFTQLFGNYLLNKKLITSEQLKDALDLQKSVHVKLGVMAVNSGFMSADDVNKVHKMQLKIDKKFGELAIEMGFLDEEKLQILLSTQKSENLLLGQAIVDRNYMSLEEFEKALDNYKKDYSITNEQLKLIQDGDVDEVINAFYDFNKSSQSEAYKSYFSLLIRNIIRFIDNDFKLLDIAPIKSYKLDWVASQEVMGELKLHTYITADEEAFINFASKYADEDYKVNDEYVKSSVGEFLNLVNGLFLVNMSSNNIELELTPQEVYHEKDLKELDEAFCIPLVFSFGRIDFIISRPNNIK